ncbi:unnamed protein product [Lactuca virosa]|uniref:Uncharacterized protein n=1 Tax=Lactuca virosa TaxID=75947 RepID=A0AAU9M340_9ASTR|nr:unnamed protein product [Lactuca virosa]
MFVNRINYYQSRSNESTYLARNEKPILFCSLRPIQEVESVPMYSYIPFLILTQNSPEHFCEQRDTLQGMKMRRNYQFWGFPLLPLESRIQ